MKKQVFNPFLPLDAYIPDGEPHVFGDRVYLFGSHDKEGGDTFCMLPYEIWSAPVGDLSDWTNKGVNYRAEQDPLAVKENAYLRGAMLGYTRKFMDETYEQIIDFAELKEFEDRPFKHLSSGMKSRLAFSIASLVRPDILILDEVLSVGDGAFSKKSEAKMKEIINGGATTILVSHSLEQVRSMCNKILWLHKGKQVTFGSDVQKICDDYQSFLDGKLKI